MDHPGSDRSEIPILSPVMSPAFPRLWMVSDDFQYIQWLQFWAVKYGQINCLVVSTHPLWSHWFVFQGCSPQIQGGKLANLFMGTDQFTTPKWQPCFRRINAMKSLIFVGYALYLHGIPLYPLLTHPWLYMSIIIPGPLMARLSWEFCWALMSLPCLQCHQFSSNMVGRWEIP